MVAKRHVCDICSQSRRPVGHAVREGHGWAVYRWNRDNSVASDLATQGEAMKLLWALKHRWSSCTVRFARGTVTTLDLREL